MMNNQKWSLAVVNIAIASGIAISSSVSAQPLNHDTGGTRILNSPTFNTGGGSGGDSSPARRATIDSADDLSNSINQTLEQIEAIEAAQQAAKEGPVRIVRRSDDKECVDPNEAQRELESLLKEAQEFIDEQNTTQPNEGSW